MNITQYVAGTAIELTVSFGVAAADLDSGKELQKKLQKVRPQSMESKLLQGTIKEGLEDYGIPANLTGIKGGDSVLVPRTLPPEESWLTRLLNEIKEFWQNADTPIKVAVVAGAVVALVLLMLCCRYCCCRRKTYVYARTAIKRHVRLPWRSRASFMYPLANRAFPDTQVLKRAAPVLQMSQKAQSEGEFFEEVDLEDDSFWPDEAEMAIRRASDDNAQQFALGDDDDEDDPWLGAEALQMDFPRGTRRSAGGYASLDEKDYDDSIWDDAERKTRKTRKPTGGRGSVLSIARATLAAGRATLGLPRIGKVKGMIKRIDTFS